MIHRLLTKVKSCTVLRSITFCILPRVSLGEDKYCSDKCCNLVSGALWWLRQSSIPLHLGVDILEDHQNSVRWGPVLKNWELIHNNTALWIDKWEVHTGPERNCWSDLWVVIIAVDFNINDSAIKASSWHAENCAGPARKASIASILKAIRNVWWKILTLFADFQLLEEPEVTWNFNHSSVTFVDFWRFYTKF